ncbi:glycoside hydrolase TIM-barrel-like domain-containing protein [Algibacter sp. AS12]|uniref:glycoside hydrolase family 113 n=1 Tax=Algibacter sp. AS12 TaxID=3135773 RepID=UPI00398B5484
MKPFKLLFLLSILAIQSCKTQTNKINGVSFVSSRQPIDQTHTHPVANLNANYAAVMPFGFIRDLSLPEVKFNGERQWYGERKEGAAQYITELNKQHIKIMLKPQIWVGHGQFTGYIKMTNEADWKTLEDSYSKFILEYADLAAKMNVQIFCIGTELEGFISNRPDYWFKLIKDVKAIYKGKLTYAANWDEFKRTPFWSELDFIGVDAYFPVSESKTPTIAECLLGWEKHKADILKVHQEHKKPILFTEYGYRSVDYTGKAPWVSDRSMTQVNFDAQTNTTQALFDTFWKEDWFAGGFIWKWFHDHEKSGGESDSRFTPQNKPVEALIRKHYKSYE